uniref:Putative Glutamine dumper 2 n=1 Tax=Davidia involucrata TaxID=16924 RepID=A0A5B7A9K0_DAVIN
MRPTNTTAAAAATTTVDAGFQRWNSPIPYLYGGLALMLGLVALALVILACSYKKSSSGSSTEVEEKPDSKPVNVLRPEMEPKIVVIMAGDDNPTYLAKPIISSIRHSEEV